MEINSNWFSRNLDFPEMAGVPLSHFPSKTLPFGENRSCFRSRTDLTRMYVNIPFVLWDAPWEFHVFPRKKTANFDSPCFEHFWSQGEKLCHVSYRLGVALPGCQW